MLSVVLVGQTVFVLCLRVRLPTPTTTISSRSLSTTTSAQSRLVTGKSLLQAKFSDMKYSLFPQSSRVSRISVSGTRNDWDRDHKPLPSLSLASLPTGVPKLKAEFFDSNATSTLQENEDSAELEGLSQNKQMEGKGSSSKSLTPSPISALFSVLKKVFLPPPLPDHLRGDKGKTGKRSSDPIIAGAKAWHYTRHYLKVSIMYVIFYMLLQAVVGGSGGSGETLMAAVNGGNTPAGSAVAGEQVKEVAYSTLLRLLDTNPDKVSDLTIDSTGELVSFTVDSAAKYVARVAAVPPLLVEKMLAAKLPFRTAATTVTSTAVATAATSKGLLDKLTGYFVPAFLSDYWEVGSVPYILTRTLGMLLVWTFLFKVVFPTLWSLYCLLRTIREIDNNSSDGPFNQNHPDRLTEHIAKQHDRESLTKQYGKPLTFDDVAGLSQAKVEVNEVVEMLKEGPRYAALGARIPSGVLMVGPPGSGKTLLARVAASTAGVPFFSCSGSEFMEMYVGRGSARMRSLFDEAQRYAPSIVFIDEIDTIGRLRGGILGGGLGGHGEEQGNTLNQLLTCMDGLDTSNNGVIVMAATNR